MFECFSNDVQVSKIDLKQNFNTDDIGNVVWLEMSEKFVTFPHKIHCYHIEFTAVVAEGVARS